MSVYYYVANQHSTVVLGFFYDNRPESLTYGGILQLKNLIMKICLLRRILGKTDKVCVLNNSVYKSSSAMVAKGTCVGQNTYLGNRYRFLLYYYAAILQYFSTSMMVT